MIRTEQQALKETVGSRPAASRHPILRPNAWAALASTLLANVSDIEITEGLRVHFEERAGTAGYCGNLSRPEAERLAFRLLLDKLESLETKEKQA